MHVELFLTKLARKHFTKVHNFDLICVPVELKVQRRTHSGERRLNVERQVKLIWED